LSEQVQKTTKVLSRIKDYFMEAIGKFSKTIGDATRTLQDSLKRIEKDLKAIELGGLPTSEQATSTAVITTVLAKRGEMMSTQDLWSAISGRMPGMEPVPAQAPVAATPVAPPSEEKGAVPMAPPSEPVIGPPSVPPSEPPSALLESELEMEVPQPPSVPVEVPAAAPPAPMAAAMAAPSLTDERPTVGSLKSEMLKELKRLKKLMTGIT
jgi:hypothetical protein